MNYLFELTHPKHYYQFRAVIQGLQKTSSNTIIVIARDKDVLLDVLNEDKVLFSVYGKHGKSMLSKFLVLPKLFYNYWRIIKKYKVDVVVSKASPYAAILSKFTSVKTIITPDSEIVKLTTTFVAPRATVVITPQNFSINFGPKHKRILGFFEDCYLHPSVFQADLGLVEELGFSLHKPYFILRFISWNANHDINNYGFSQDEKIKIVNKLLKFGDVYITSESELPFELEKYRIKIPASKIHHVLHYATMYIGDSQTMATESALLGTPAIRYNSFVGQNDMTNFILLEEKYKLLKNYNVFSDLMICIDDFISNPENKNKWLNRRKEYYAEVGDVNKDLLSIIENVSKS